MQTIVLYLCYIVLILLFSTAYNTSLIYCFVIWCLHTNKRRPCSSSRLVFGFLGWYHLPSVCNGLELEFVIVHGICHIWACSPSILHGISYMWACSPSILYGICHILACSPYILHGICYSTCGRLHGILHGILLQFGFRSSRSTIDPLFCLRRLTDVVEQGHDKFILIFLDWEKAFDKISHEKMFQSLHRMSIPVEILDAIKAIYQKPMFQVMHRDKFSSWLSQRTGIRQGCPLSPYLFIVTMHVLFHDVHRRFNDPRTHATQKLSKELISTNCCTQMTHSFWPKALPVLTNTCTLSKKNLNIWTSI